MKYKLKMKNDAGQYVEEPIEINNEWGTLAITAAVGAAVVVAGNVATRALGLGYDDDIDTGEIV